MTSTGISLASPPSDLRGEQLVFKPTTQAQTVAAPVTPTPQPAPTPQQPVTVTQGRISGSFEYDQAVNRVIITLRNEKTGEIVEQIPNEHIIKMLTNVMQEIGKTLDVKS